MSILPWGKKKLNGHTLEPEPVVVVKQKRVLGFMFDFRDRYVLLMSHRPEGQPVEFLSGIGGRLPDDEADPGLWMQLAAQEATGLHVSDWMPALILDCPSSITYVFMTMVSSTDLKQAKPQLPQIKDTCKMIAIDNLNHYRCAPMLPWIIPMLNDPLMVYPATLAYGEPDGGE